MKKDKMIIAIGGGSIAEKTTLKIDEYIANLAKTHAGDKRAVGVFIGTASHDSMPYFNSFRKTYTSNFDIKADCVLSVYGEMNEEKINSKFEKADLIYIGGGDTLFMLDHWKKTGVYQKVLNAYNRGVIIAGLSAGAICWFERMYTDSEQFHGGEGYSFADGIGILSGACCPHYEQRKADFMQAFTSDSSTDTFLLQGDSAAVFINGKFERVLSSGGKAFKATKRDGKIIEEEIE